LTINGYNYENARRCRYCYSTISARVTESQKLKMVGYPAWHRIYFGNTELKWVKCRLIGPSADIALQMMVR